MGRLDTTNSSSASISSSKRSLSRQSSASSSLAQRVGDRVAGDSPPRQDVALQPLTSSSSSSSTTRSTVTVSPSHPALPVQDQGHVLPYQVPASHLPLPLSLRTAATPAASASAPASASVASTSTHASGPSSVLIDYQDAALPSGHIDTDGSLDATLQQPDNNLDMASKKTPFLRSTAARPDAAPYGSVSLTPSRNNSPAGSDRWDPDAHPLRHVPDTMRSETSHRSMLSKKSSSRLSEEIDGAVLVSGLEGRLGIAEPTHTGILEGSVKDDVSEDGALLDDNSSAASDTEYQENSPHEAVRASVPPTDNTTLSINTPRMWCLSVIFAVLGSSTNLFFSLRYPSVAITPVIALLLVHPLGHLWDFVLKRPYDLEEEFVDGVRIPAVADDSHDLHKVKRLTRWRLWLAQGSWNEKEHTCVYVSSNVAFGFAFATDVIVEQTQFYNQEAPIVYQLLLTISTQILGYGFAGITRRFLVRPSGMIWPGTLMSAAMFSTLHKQENKPAGSWTISRWKFFYIVWTISFLFYFLPGLLMPALSYFNVITWFAPKNVVIANLFGVSSGLGLFPLTFDWAQVTYVGSPLLVPFWAAMNVIGGLAVVMWIIAPILYYSNVLFSSYMPILSAAVFDNKGKVYDVSKILTPEFVFDKEAYHNYSRVFLPITYVLSYGVQFAGLAALLTHTACWHGQDIWSSWKLALKEAREDGQAKYEPVVDSPDQLPRQSTDNDQRRMSSSTSHVDGIISREDIHSKLMKRYKDAPLSWYLITFLSMTAIGIFVVEYYPVHLPWYGLLLALGLGALFFLPNGIIMAVTNQHSSIYLICQLICGVVFPGRPIANMVFVTYGYISSAQGIKFASDLKLGHYMKIPPRILFLVQIVATLVSSLTQIGVLNWMFANIKGICTAQALNGFTCPIARVHFNGSILWGVVGPNEFFGPKAIYRSLVWFFPLGALLPVPLWLYSRRHRSSILRKVNLPVIFGAMSWIPPATGLNFSVWVLVCYVFNYLIKNRHNAWWSKYTMTLSAALDSGLAFGIVVVFFGFIYPGLANNLTWWGTEVYKQGCDWQACSYKTLPEGERFGPKTW
ncbi:OPT oligopeptide transporter protein-domain-containing protein [Fusarium avenaceum]|nr:OPT oligopeptide transporter protein-domain-containing protein [Fusarium avenaceum]